jgi:long-chain acyl-CoA synthetase
MDRPAANLNQALLAAMDTYAGQVCFWTRGAGQFKATSYSDFQTQAFRLAGFFRGRGISAGERVAIIAANSVEWMLAYVACLLAGGVAVPLRSFLPPRMLHLRLQESSACLAVIQNRQQYELIKNSGADLSYLETVLLVEPEPDLAESAPVVISLVTILAGSITTAEQELIRARAEAFDPRTLAAIHYTGGTFDRSKGAMFDHGQRLAALQSMVDWFPLNQDDLAFTTPLPFSYIPNLDAALHYFLSGVANALAGSTQTSFEDLQQLSPTVTLVTPNAFEYIYQQVISELNRLSASNREIFHWALAISREYRAAGSAASKKLREEYARADMTFFSQIRGMLGGRLYRFYSVGAPLPPQGVEFAEAIGLRPLNVYSLTEAGGFPAASRPDSFRPGSCGQVLPGFEIRIAEDRELLLRGQTVARHYWRQPSSAEPALDAEGWLHSGDLGYFDEAGYLYLTGYKYTALVLSTGRKIVPAAIENALTTSPFVAQAALFGEGQRYVSALIVPDLPTIAAHLQSQANNQARLPLTVAHPAVKTLIDDVVRTVNSQVDGWEQIENYTLLDRPFSEEDGELTASQKIHRQVIAERYAAQIEAMYPQPLPQVEQTIASVQLDPERLRELLEKENILDAWMADAGIEFLFELARSKQIDAPSVVHLCDTAAAIAQMKNEEKPLSTAFIVGDPARIAHILPPGEIQLRANRHIRQMRRMVITLARLVDGHALGYVLDKYGFLRGIHKLNVTLAGSSDFLLGPRFSHLAAISRHCDALIFFIPRGGRQVRVFANGQMVGRYTHGNWLAESSADIDQKLIRLAQAGNHDLALLRRLLRCAFQMSEDNLGAIFIMGEAETILKRSDSAEIASFVTILSDDLDHLSDRELINFARQDGSTLIDLQGRFRGCMILLRPAANTRADVGPGRGARHSSAAKISAEAGCLAIAVSQDGPITIYDRGQRLLSL